MEDEMTNFPKTIIVSFYEKGSNIPIANLSALIHLFANHKNDYWFALSVSNKDGKVIMTYDELDRQQYIQASSAIMDYGSDLEDCKPQFEISVGNEDEIQNSVSHMRWLLSFLEEEAVGISAEQLSAMESASNSLYKPNKQLFTFDGNRKIDCLEVTMYLERV
jgi:hypothetical protein